MPEKLSVVEELEQLRARCRELEAQLRGILRPARPQAVECPKCGDKASIWAGIWKGTPAKGICNHCNYSWNVGDAKGPRELLPVDETLEEQEARHKKKAGQTVAAA